MRSDTLFINCYRYYHWPKFSQFSAYASTLPGAYFTQPHSHTAATATATHSHTHTHTHGGAAQLEEGYLTVSASWPSALKCQPCNHAPLTVREAAEAVTSTPHSSLTTLCPTHCSPVKTARPLIDIPLYSPSKLFSKTIFNIISITTILSKILLIIIYLIVCFK